MSNCTKCRKGKKVSDFGKLGNGLRKKTCIVCCLKQKKNKTTEDKTKLNLIKVHKDLHRKFKPHKLNKLQRENKRLNQKTNKTTEDKVKLNLIKVHKDLHRKFKPQRKAEYAKKYNQNYKQPNTIYCPVFKKPHRTCHHCTKPNDYLTESNTMVKHNEVLNQIKPLSERTIIRLYC